jgi:hypothetical protein
MIRKIANTPHPIDEYFRVAGCRPKKIGGGVKSPVLHLVAEAPCSRVEYPEIIYRYYTVKREAPNIWLEVVNAKSTIDDTFLDYIDRLDRDGNYNTPDVRECRNRLISFACKTGGVYSTAKNKRCLAG